MNRSVSTPVLCLLQQGQAPVDDVAVGARAGAIGIRFQQMQKYEKGVNRVGAGRLAEIAAALDVPVTLLDGAAGVSPKTATPAAALALIARAQPLRLVKALASIDDKGVRRSLLGLTEGIARQGKSRT